MKKERSYNKIYGCPFHGTKQGHFESLKWRMNESGNPCFLCNICKRAYLEPSSDELGSTKLNVMYKGNLYDIYHITGPVCIPKVITVYDNKVSGKPCKCVGKKKRKMKTITHFLLKSGDTVKVQDVRVCTNCGKVYVPLKSYEYIKELCQNNGIRIDFDESINRKIETSNKEASVETVATQIDNTASNYISDWKAYIEEENYNISKVTTLDVNCLKPANKVAAAYYDANIKYNPYQYLPWLKMFINRENKLLISDEVGLGKTIEAGILMMEELTENVNARIVVLCPAFLREKWYQELKEKFFLDPQIYDGKTPIDWTTNVVILPISRIIQYLDNDNSINFDMVIVDEVHYFKNSSSRRYVQLSLFLSKLPNAKYIFMSATPINNSGNDYNSIKRLFGQEHERTNTTKKQAYINLPERHINDIYVDLTLEEQKYYDATDVLDPFSGTIYRHIGSSCLYALGKYAFTGAEYTSETKEELRTSLEMLLDGMEPINDDGDFVEKLQLAVQPDIDSKLESIKNVIEKYECGTKIVIFSHYIETVKYLHSELSKLYSTGYIYANNISNNIPSKHKKNKFIDAKEWFFKGTKDTTILICSDSCREGIDLDFANVLVNYDLPFNPSILEQRIGRIDRMSQKSDMDIYNFHVNNTYDDRLHFILNAKLRFINYYANYGIGNPLNITGEDNNILKSFIRYFGNQFTGNKNNSLMSNDDFQVVSKVLKQIGFIIDKNAKHNSLKMQAILLDKLNEHLADVNQWFTKQELKELTDEQLWKQWKILDSKLNFPKKIQRKIIMDEKTQNLIVSKANTDIVFRKRIAMLIQGYSEKLSNMEIKGEPMQITNDDILLEYEFGSSKENSFIQNSIIEVLRNMGAKVYEVE